MRSFRVVLAGCYLVAVLTSVACGDIHTGRPVTVDPPSHLLGPAPMHTTTTTTTTTTVDRRASGRWYAVARLNDVARWNASAKKNAETAARSGADSRSVNSRRNTGAGLPKPAVSAPSGSCWALLQQYFGDDLAWAQRTVRRESGCTAAVNQHEGCDTSGRTNSRAEGPFQMCVPMHEPTFAAVGCSGRYLDIECNIKAARRLYDSNGHAPWGG